MLGKVKRKGLSKMTDQLNYTIVEPGFEFIPPSDKYLEFLEQCTRTCYKSEDHIKEGSAEKLMSKVVKEYEHLSVTEHSSCIMDIECDDPQKYLFDILAAADPIHRQAISLFAMRSSFPRDGVLRISGNIRMWMELMQSEFDITNSILYRGIENALFCKWPFFFSDRASFDAYETIITILDDNPLTNRSDLSKDDMMRHMTLTCKLIGDRSMSHQLVRHRLAAYSQESQRYCNYGKKGFQFVIPPTTNDKSYDAFRIHAIEAYDRYLSALERGMKPEDARGLLPNCTKTEVVTTFTLGMWEHFFDHRGRNPKAQWQIRGIAQGIEKKFKELIPEVFGP